MRCLDPQTHLNFLTSLLSRIDTKQSQESHVLLLASIAHAKLLYGDLEGTKSDMDAAQKILEPLENVENSVNAEFYSVSADYYKVHNKTMYVFTQSAERSVRQKQSMPHITRIPYSTSHASTLKQACLPKNA